MAPADDAAAYSLVGRAPSADAYCALRQVAGLSPRTRTQAAAAITGTWSACHVVARDSDVPVAMGRVIGDGGWYFHVADMATHPDHQRRGLGAAVMTWLLRSIHVVVGEDPEPYVTLMADPPGRPLYERFGFVDTAPASVGMTARPVTGSQAPQVVVGDQAPQLRADLVAGADVDAGPDAGVLVLVDGLLPRRVGASGALRGGAVDDQRACGCGPEEVRQDRRPGGGVHGVGAGALWCPGVLISGVQSGILGVLGSPSSSTCSAVTGRHPK